MADHVNLVKLCVGIGSVAELEAWRETHPAAGLEGLHRHVTRMWPKRAAELLEGGSLYWVIGGAILARQRVLRLDEVVGRDGIRRCGIVMEPTIVRTEPAPRRPFQGWRYLAPGDSPRDLRMSRPGESVLPPGMAEALAEFGVR